MKHEDIICLDKFTLHLTLFCLKTENRRVCILKGAIDKPEDGNGRKEDKNFTHYKKNK